MSDSSEILREFSFADGQYLAHFSDGDTCVMDYLNWREELYRFVFSGVALVRAFCGSVSLCQATIATDSDLITEARCVLADDWGTSGGPKGITLTELAIFDDVPVFSIVFADVRIIGPIHSDQRMKMGVTPSSGPN
jgi:hypothetical protein